jgi:regulator of sigma E protease
MANTDEKKAEILGSEGKAFMQPRLTNILVDSIMVNSNASKAGLLKNDKIVKINNQPITYFDEIGAVLDQNKSGIVNLTVNRNGKEVVLKSSVSNEGKLGFFPKFKEKKDFIITTKMSFLQAIPAAVNESYTMFVYKIKEFKLLLSPKTGAYKQVKSPIGITRILPTTWDWEFVWSFTAMFSIALAFMNLLPIPGLDGGHAIFTIAEMITGRTLSVKAAERVQTFGMIILLSLMALTFGKDIYEIIFK